MLTFNELNNAFKSSFKMLKVCSYSYTDKLIYFNYPYLDHDSVLSVTI